MKINVICTVVNLIVWCSRIWKFIILFESSSKGRMKFLESVTDTCVWYAKLPVAWQTYPHPGFLEIATAAIWVWRRMVDHANDGHLLPHSLREQRPCAFLNVQFQIKQLWIFWLFFQTNLIIINHPHGPSLANNVQKMVPKYSMTAGLTSFDKLSVPLDYLHYMFHHRHILIEQ